MITDNRNSLKILTCTDSKLTILGAHSEKMTYKQFRQIPPVNQCRIMRWLQFSHPNLLSIYKVQKLVDPAGATTLGMYYEHFGGCLKDFLSFQSSSFQEQEIVNTFHPILEAFEYLTLQKFELSHVQLKNIVITQDQDIKYIDESLISPLQLPIKNTDNSKSYQELAEIIYRLLIESCKEKSPKSWKARLQLIRQKFSKDTYSFFLNIFNKTLINPNEVEKTKKISKKPKQTKIEGKENKLVQ